jgi:hypothetical protein
LTLLPLVSSHPQLELVEIFIKLAPETVCKKRSMIGYHCMLLVTRMLPTQVINTRNKRSGTPLSILMKRAESDPTCSRALDFIIKSEVVKFFVEKGANWQEEENEVRTISCVYLLFR